MNARGRVRRVELPGVRDRRSVRAEFEKPQIILRRGAIGLKQPRIRQGRARCVGPRALRHIALRNRHETCQARF